MDTQQLIPEPLEQYCQLFDPTFTRPTQQWLGPTGPMLMVGLLYVMHIGTGDTWTPRYIGKAERRGVKHEVSVNLLRLRHDPSKFARWGYHSAYHLGELSHAVFGGEFQISALLPKASYTRWAAALFASLQPPVLKEPVNVTLLPWWADSQGPSGLIGSVAAVEYELIALASAEYGEQLLNVQGR